MEPNQAIELADLNHERERLHQGVDTFIDSFEKHEDYEDARIDIFGIVTMVTWKTEDDEDAEAPFMWFDSRRNHVQLGVLRTCLLELEGSYYNPYYQGATPEDNDDDD